MTFKNEKNGIINAILKISKWKLDIDDVGFPRASHVLEVLE